ncbi:acid protease [Didymella exigua CBS 183.55]|uniref:Acid protease n=1 Tax=Didymella exigua CBS 183.55 TaxID=1150837 RepID=A0A6A5R3I6_9PLEO|nr:acid protease [Didymella exigua CBS 183.55]KAF1922203.1 acid protease [Didymella exigua CBS 183.55]
MSFSKHTMVLNLCALYLVAALFAFTRAQKANTSPLIIAPSGKWDGADGPWSTFNFGVGDPIQPFRCLPGISFPFIVLPVQSDWCNETCEAQTTIFRPEGSSTWRIAGLWSVNGYDDITGYDDGSSTSNDSSAIFGVDSVSLGHRTKDILISQYYVLGSRSKRFYVGTFGLAVGSSWLSKEIDKPKVLDSLYDAAHSIPSRSFGYTAGSATRNILGSLVLGGYDALRFDDSTTTTWSFVSAQNTTCIVQLAGISVTNTGDTVTEPQTYNADFTPGPIRIDSSVPQIWLPEQACKVFEITFGLTWDNSLKLYLINETTHERLTRDKPAVRFTLNSGTKSVNYTFPYTAFTLTLAFPFVDKSTYYFPLKRTSNPTQYMLGRAFLQETYITVDYERSNFSISQAYPDGGSTMIVSIQNTTFLLSPSPDSNESNGLSTAAYVGIGVGAGIGALVAVGVLVAWRQRWRRNNGNLRDYFRKAELHGDHRPRVEVMGKERLELGAASSTSTYKTMKKEISELETVEYAVEMSGGEALAVPGITLLHELPGRDESERSV